MVILTSKSPEDTYRLGVELSAGARPGRVIGLVGDLGAGKTQLVKGFANGLGVSERIHSPTFTLLNEYCTGRVPLYHLDLYRLDNFEQVRAAGLDVYLPPRDGVSIIEWFDRVADGLALPDLLVVSFAVTSDNEREIGYEDPRT